MLNLIYNYLVFLFLFIILEGNKMRKDKCIVFKEIE